MQNKNIAVSISEIENNFFNHIADAGVTFTGRPIADGILHRTHAEGDKRGTKNGAYILHADSNPSGWFQHFNTGIYGKWTLSGKREPINKTMWAEINADREKRKIEQQERHNDAADKGRFIWHSAKPITEQSQHSYLIKKRVQPHGARLYGHALVVPIYAENKQIVNLQFIDADGTKRFLSGGKKKGCFSVIGKPDVESPIFIAEGFSTSSSLYEATGHFTVVALDAGNLESVARVFRRLFPDRQIILAADNDLSGVGQNAARAAALAVGGKYIVPAQAGMDWNDFLNMEVAL